MSLCLMLHPLKHQALEKAIGEAMPNSVHKIQPILKQIASFKAPGRYYLKHGVTENFKKTSSESGRAYSSKRLKDTNLNQPFSGTMTSLFGESPQNLSPDELLKSSLGHLSIKCLSEMQVMCEKEYHVGCLRERGMCDLKDKWFCCDDCDKIFSTLQLLTSSGPQVIQTLVSAAIFRNHAAVVLNNIALQWHILSGKSRQSEHLLLFSQAAAIFRECFDPIVAKSGRDLILVMVYGQVLSLFHYFCCQSTLYVKK